MKQGQQLQAVFAAGLLQQIVDVKFDRAFRHVQLLGDLCIGALRQQQAQHPAFPGGQIKTGGKMGEEFFLTAYGGSRLQI